MLLLLLLFPDGRPLTPRWRPLVGAAILAMLPRDGHRRRSSFTSEPPLQGVHNPLALSGAWVTAIDFALAVAVPLTIVALLGGVASMVLRFRRSTGTERQQVKWVVAGVAHLARDRSRSSLALIGRRHRAGSTTIPFVLSIVALPRRDGARDPAVPAVRRRPRDPQDPASTRASSRSWEPSISAGSPLLGSLSLSATGPVERGRRHRRPRSSWRLRSSRCGGGSSTAIDRRFSRRTVDAETALRAFSGRLREEVDLDALCGELLGVVEHTFQPRHTSLWLRPPEQA